jgi:hypothetical protein
MNVELRPRHSQKGIHNWDFPCSATGIVVQYMIVIQLEPRFGACINEYCRMKSTAYSVQSLESAHNHS